MGLQRRGMGGDAGHLGVGWHHFSGKGKPHTRPRLGIQCEGGDSNKAEVIYDAPDECIDLWGYQPDGPCNRDSLVVFRFVISWGTNEESAGNGRHLGKDANVYLVVSALSSQFDKMSIVEHNDVPLLRNMLRKYRSLCWLPILDPFSKFVIIWSNFLMVFDLTYTAFFLPISVGFKTNVTNTDANTPVVFMLVVDVLAGKD